MQSQKGVILSAATAHAVAESKDPYPARVTPTLALFYARAPAPCSPHAERCTLHAVRSHAARCTLYPMLSAVVITVSDSTHRGERADASGPAVATLLREHGFDVVGSEVVPDERDAIERALIRGCDAARLVVTTGGTGLAARDVTPEATLAVCSRIVPGIAERMRAQGMSKTPLAALSRAVCAVRGTSLVLNLPGSPRGATESLAAVVDVLPHALAILAGQTGH